MAYTNQPVLDRTSRDRAAIIDDFIRPGGYLEQEFGAEFIEFMTTELGFALIDLIAGIGDTYNAAADHIGNEGYIATATETQSIIDHARGLTYTPRSNTASKTVVTLTTAFTDPITITAGTILLTNPNLGPQIEFEVETTVVKPSGATTLQIPVISGRTVEHPDFIASGSGILSTELVRPKVINGSIIYTVDGVVWTEVDDFDESGPNDLHYRIRVNEFIPGRRLTVVETGDGQSGKIPPAGSVVSIDYRVGGGTSSNVPLNSINLFEEPLVDTGGTPIQYTLANTVAATQLGQDAETKDEIRVNAPIHARTCDKLSSNQDHEDAARANGALRALALTNNEASIVEENTVLLFVATSLSTSTPTTDAETIRTSILAAFPGRDTRRLIVAPCQVKSFTYEITILLRSTGNEGVVRPLVDTALSRLFASDALIGDPPRFVQQIGQPVYASNIKSVIDRIPSVSSVTLTQGNVVPEPFELPITDLNSWTITFIKETT